MLNLDSDLYGPAIGEEGGTGSAFWGTAEAGLHQAGQLLTGFGYLLAKRMGDPTGAAQMAHASAKESQYREEAISGMPSSSQRLLNAGVTSEEAWENPLGYLAAQSLLQVPTIAAFGTAGALGGLPAGAAVGAVSMAGDYGSTIAEAYGSMTEDEARDNPAIAAYLSQGYTLQGAIDQASSDAIGYNDLYSAAMGAGFGVLEPAVWIGRALKGGKGIGIGRGKGAAAGAVAGGGGEFSEEYLTAVEQNISAERSEGAIPEQDPMEAGLIGLALGLAPGAVGGFASGGGRKNSQVTNVPAGQPNPAQVQAITGPQPMQTPSFQTGTINPPVAPAPTGVPPAVPTGPERAPAPFLTPGVTTNAPPAGATQPVPPPAAPPNATPQNVQGTVPGSNVAPPPAPGPAPAGPPPITLDPAIEQALGGGTVEATPIREADEVPSEQAIPEQALPDSKIPLGAPVQPNETVIPIDQIAPAPTGEAGVLDLGEITERGVPAERIAVPSAVPGEEGGTAMPVAPPAPEIGAVEPTTIQDAPPPEVTPGVTTLEAVPEAPVVEPPANVVQGPENVVQGPEATPVAPEAQVEPTVILEAPAAISTETEQAVAETLPVVEATPEVSEAPPLAPTEPDLAAAFSPSTGGRVLEVAPTPENEAKILEYRRSVEPTPEPVQTPKQKAEAKRQAAKEAATTPEDLIRAQKIPNAKKKKLTETDPAVAKDLFDRHAMTADDYRQPALLGARLAQIVDEADANRVQWWEKVTAATPDFMVWLTNARDTLNQIKKSLDSKETKDAILAFQAGERAMTVRDAEHPNGHVEVFRGEHGATSVGRSGGGKAAQTKGGAKGTAIVDVEDMAATTVDEAESVIDEREEGDEEVDTATEITDAIPPPTPANDTEKVAVEGVDYTRPKEGGNVVVVQKAGRQARKVERPAGAAPVTKITLAPRKPKPDVTKQEQAETKQVEDNVEAVQPKPEAPVSRETPRDDAEDAILAPRPGPTDLDAQARQERQNKELAHTIGAVNFFGNWVRPVQEMTLAGAIERFKGRTGNKVIDALRNRILTAIAAARGDVPVYILDPKDIHTAKGRPPYGAPDSAGFYMPWHENNPNGKDFIVIASDFWQKEGVAHYLVTHEGIHAIITDTLSTMPQLKTAMEEVFRLVRERHNLRGYKDVVDDRTYHYGATSVGEMFSEMADEQFVTYMQDTPIPRDLAKRLGLEPWRKATAWNGIVALVRKVLEKTLGIQAPFTAFDAVLSSFERATHTRDNKARTEYYRRATETGVINDPSFASVEREFQQARGRVRSRDKQRRDAINEYFSDMEPRAALEVEDRVSAEMAIEAARAASAQATKYGPGTLKRWMMKLASLDELMRRYENLFPADTLRRYVNAIVRRYTLAQQKIGQDTKVLVKEAGLLRKYQDAKIGGVSIQEHYAELANAMDNWKVDPRLPITQHHWLGTNAKSGIVAKKHYPKIKQAYDELVAAAPDLATYLGERMDYFGRKYKEATDALLTDAVLDAAENQGNVTLSPAGALAMGKRVVEGNATSHDEHALGKTALERIAKAPEFKPVFGPYQPQRRWGDWVLAAQIDVKDPTSGQWMRPPTSKHYTLTGYHVDFYGKDAEQQAEKFATENRDFDEYTEVNSIWTDANGHTHDPATGHKFEAKDVQQGAEQRWRVFVQDEHTEFFESQMEADQAAESLKKDPYYKTIKPVRLKKGEPASGQALAGSHQLQSIAASLQQRLSKMGATPQMAAQLTAVVNEAAHRAAPGGSISKHRLNRRHVQGNSRDTLRVMHDYIHAINNYIAAVETARETHEAFKVLDTHAQSNYGTDAITPQAVLNEIESRRNAFVGMHEGNSFTNFLTSWQFIDKLGSPGYSLVNMTQLPMVGIPVLAEKHGIYAASRAIGKAARQIGYVQNLKTGGKESWTALRNRLDTATSFHDFIKSGNLTSEVKTMLDKLVEYGTLDPDAGFEAMNVVIKGKGSKMLNYVETVFRQFPRAVEANNRYTMALAAFDLAKAKGMSTAKATEYARDAVDRSQFNYNPVNSAPFFNTAVGRVGFQFMKFGFNMYQLMGAQLTNVFKKSSTGQERMEALRGFTYLLGAHFIVGGAAGLPLEPIRAVMTVLNAAGVTDVTMDDVEAYVREVAAETFGSTGFSEVLSRGLPRALGFDLSNRITLGQLLFQRPMGEIDEAGAVSAYILRYIGGPTVQNADDLFVGMRDLTEGNIVRAVEKIIPVKMFSDFAKAYRGATEGIKTKYGDVYQTYDLPGAVLQTFGITPAANARTIEFRGRYYSLQSREAEERRQILLDYRENPGQRGSMYRRFQEFNKRWNPISPLNIKAAQDSLKEHSGDYKKGVKVENANQRRLEYLERTYGE